MDSDKPLAGGIPMVSIDGVMIRRIREEKGLTQLYVATVVGVTTDTISRWENRRYPNIKKENALKLAQALETPLTDIIDHSPVSTPPESSTSQAAETRKPDEQPTPQQKEPEIQPAPEPTPPQSVSPANRPAASRLASQPRVVLFSAFLLLTLIGLALFWWHTANNEAAQVEAVRILPEHVTPDLAFPVVIEVTSSDSETKPFSLILKETLPPGCIAIQGKPQFVPMASNPPVLKWIGKLTGAHAIYGYIAKFRSETKMESHQQFTGGLTVHADDNPSIAVSGPDTLQVTSFHWADTNSDGRIDDEELLSVYEIYGEIEGLNFGKKLIEEIWASKGYRWKPETRSYEILQ